VDTIQRQYGHVLVTVSPFGLESGRRTGRACPSGQRCRKPTRTFSGALTLIHPAAGVEIHSAGLAPAGRRRDRDPLGRQPLGDQSGGHAACTTNWPARMWSRCTVATSDRSQVPGELLELPAAVRTTDTLSADFAQRDCGAMRLPEGSRCSLRPGPVKARERASSASLRPFGWQGQCSGSAPFMTAARAAVEGDLSMGPAVRGPTGCGVPAGEIRYTLPRSLWGANPHVAACVGRRRSREVDHDPAALQFTTGREVDHECCRKRITPTAPPKTRTPIPRSPHPFAAALDCWLVVAQLIAWNRGTRTGWDPWIHDRSSLPAPARASSHACYIDTARGPPQRLRSIAAVDRLQHGAGKRQPSGSAAIEWKPRSRREPPCGSGSGWCCRAPRMGACGGISREERDGEWPVTAAMATA
jgi:hypothetical protein